MCDYAKERLFEEAIRRWGVDAQLNQLIEECAEVIVAINHYRRGKIRQYDVESELAVMLSYLCCDFIDLVDVIPRKRIDKNRPGVALIIFNLSAQHIFCVADFQAGFIVSPGRDMYFILDGFRNEL